MLLTLGLLPTPLIYSSQAAPYVDAIAALTDDVSNQRCAPFAAKLKIKISQVVHS